MTTDNWVDSVLVPLDACASAVDWARGYATLAEAWMACERPDWMLWIHARSPQADPYTYARLAKIWAERAEADAARATAARAREWAAEADATAEWAAEADAADAAEAAADWAADAATRAEWAAEAAAEAAARIQQCNDIRAALRCPEFEP